MKKFAFSFIFLMVLIPGIALTEDDIFKVKTPNVMILFDTSDSMNMSINVDSKGNSIWTNKYGPDKVTQYRKDGNHPDSKLYQAKQAMSQVIQDVVKDRVNLGFGTYAQVRIEKKRGQYKRDEVTQAAETEAWRQNKRYYLWDTTNDSTRYATSVYGDSFIDAWNVTRSGVTADPTKGSTFTRVQNIHDKTTLHPRWLGGSNFQTAKAYTITYRVTARAYNAETNVYTFTYLPISAAYDRYQEKIYSTGWSSSSVVCGSDTVDTPFPATQTGGWKTHFAGEGEYALPSGSRTAGWWSCSVEYRAPKSEVKTTKYGWYDTTGSLCAATQAGTPTWEFVPGTCYDWSAYRYTPEGTTNRPHAWSYFRIDGSSNFKRNAQNDPFYPAPAGNPGENDNHLDFINFPDDKAAGFKDSDRTLIKNKILSFLDLTPVKRSEVAEYWTRLPVHAIDGRIGLTANTEAYDAKKQTPLADSLDWAYTYFDDYINKYNGGDPSSKQEFGDTVCRRNYIILLTDGLESCKGAVDPKTGDFVPDYTAAPTNAGKLASLGVRTYVIGFGADLKGNQALINIAKAGLTDTPYFVTTLKDLKDALTNIFQAITGQFYGRSNPVITRSRDRLFRGSFEIKDGDWIGHLMAWNADQETGRLAPDFVWDAGEVLQTNPRGKAYSWVEHKLRPLRKEFKASESSLYDLVNPPVSEDINGVGGVTVDDAKAVISFTLDPGYDSGKYKGNRAVDWKLGDIYHSTPVVIKEPAFFYTEESYKNFYKTWKDRPMRIYVGTNDGTLHAFRNTDGVEDFSIVPRNLLGKVKNLRLAHDYYVDSSPKAADVFIKNDNDWRTIILSGQGKGGPYYFCVDVTDVRDPPDTSDPKPLWSWTDTGMGETWGKPDIGRVKIAGGKFVAFITGGYSPEDNKGNVFHVVDIEDGTTLKTFTIGSATNKIPSGPIAYDSDKDGYIDYVYFGDTEGTLWKVDVTSSNLAEWDKYALFIPHSSKARPIFYSPAVTKNDLGEVLVFFGTGNELALTTLTTNYFYEVKDNGHSGDVNWSKTLENGEKVLASPAVANNIVYFTSWIYTAASEFCGAGEGRLWGLTITRKDTQGGEAGLVTIDPATGRWSDPMEHMSLGAGIPSAPVVTNGMVYVSTSLNANRVIQIPIPPWAVARVKSWRERFTP
jgi:hypothetical protein